MYHLFSSLLALLLLISGGCHKAAIAVDSSESAAIADSVASTQPAKATLYFVGDAMQHQAQLDRARELAGGSGYDYSECFTLIAPEVKAADYAVVNLETPLGGGRGGYTGFPCFSSPDSFAVALKDAGFDLFLTANNHTLDRRDAGLRRTIHVLDSLGVDHIGTYIDKSARDVQVPFIKSINGIKVAFLNYTYGTNGILATDGAEVSLIDRNAIDREITAAREKGAELIVVCPHWGVEYQLHEHASQRELADFLVDRGVDMVIGSHPHVIQPMKVVTNSKTGKRTLVVYSLGNFISNMKTGDTRGGASVTCYIERDAEGKARFVSAAYDTFYAAKPSGGSSNFRVIPSAKAAEIPAAQLGWWNTFNNAAERIFSTCNVDVPHK